MKPIGCLLIVAGGMGGAGIAAAHGWAAHQAPQWEQALLRATVLQIHGQRYYVRQHPSRLLLRDFHDDQAPDWVKRAHQQPLPTGLLLSGQTGRMRWLLNVTAVPGGTQWRWAGQPLHQPATAVLRPAWLPREGKAMFSSEERHAGFRVIQQSYRFKAPPGALQQDLRARLRTADWQLEQASPEHDRWVKAHRELDLLYHRINGDSGLYLVLREADALLQ